MGEKGDEEGDCSFSFFPDEYITMKQVAAMRFHRNHRLMAEIFNDVVVPDMRTGQQRQQQCNSNSVIATVQQYI